MEKENVQKEMKNEKIGRCTHIEYCTSIKVATRDCYFNNCHAKKEFDKKGYEIIPAGF